MYIYHTGLAFETDQHYGILLFPRSSNRKTDAYLCNHVGIVDSAIYRGEIMFCYKNRTSLEARAEMEKSRTFFNSILYNSFTITNGNVVEFTWPNAVQNAMGGADWIYSNPMNFAPYKVGDRIGQMVVIPYPDVKLSERAELSETDRGSGGFGSTGN
jgi:dUTP pyrophosphatase